MQMFDPQGRKQVDDFNWSTYTRDYYLKEAIQAQERGEEFIIEGKTDRINGKIVFPKGLHQLYINLYLDVLDKKVKSVFEIGCGGGHSLFNISYLGSKYSEAINVGGMELTENQMKIMSEFYNVPDRITKNIIIGDASDSETILPKEFEYVFTNAVLMHLTDSKVNAIMKNLLIMNPKYIRFTEDLTQHNYDRLFLESGLITKYEVVTEDLPNTKLLKRR